MIRKAFVLLLALLLCLSLSACGSYRVNDDGVMYDYNGTTTNGTRNNTTDRNGTANNGTVNNGTANNGMNGYGTNNNGMNGYGADQMPDPNDGFIRDNNAGDGMIDGELSTPSPNVTHRP